MARLILIAVSVAFPILTGATGTGDISGIVFDQVSERAAVGAVVAVSGTELYAATGDDGYYHIENVPAGNHVIKVSLIGYESRAVTDVMVTPGRRTTKNIALKSMITGVTRIRAEDYFVERPDASVSTHSMSKEEIRRQPGGVGDIFRVLGTMPGVNSVDDSSDLIVRGGDPNENLTLMDDVELFSPIHYVRTYGAEGAITAVNLELIDDVEFYAGGFPAEYGDKLSAVLDIGLREGDRKNYHISTDMSMAGFGLILEGPVGPRGSFVGAGRKSFLEVLSRIVDFGTDGSVPRYYDSQGKVVYDLTPRHRISALGFYAADKIDINEDKEYAQSHAVHWYSDQRAYGLSWRWLYSDRGVLTLTGFRTGNYWNTHVYNAFFDNREKSKGFENALKLKMTYQAHPRVILTWGGSGRYVAIRSRSTAEATHSDTGEPIEGYDFLYEPDTYKAAGFAEGTIKPFERFSLTAGLRTDYLAYTGRTTVGPRVGLKFAITDKLSFNAAYGRYYQTPLYTFLAVNDLYDGPALYSGRADHYIAGITYLLAPDLEVGIEAYYKNLFDLPTYAIHEGEELIRNVGSGYARGGEIYYHKKLSGKFFSRGTYSFTQSYRRERQGAPLYPSNYDQTHSFTVLAGYEPWETWLFSAKFKYATGRPYTPITGSYYDDTLNQWFAIEGEMNSARYPYYQRLDLRFDKSFYFKHWSLTTYFDLQNAYNAKNVLFYQYNYDYSSKKPEYMWSLMPVGGFVLEF